MRRTFAGGIFLLFLSLSVIAGSFEGKINLVKKSFYDTNMYSYFVKDSMVRIDEYNKDNQLVSSYIINLMDKKVFVLNTSQKVYKEISPRKSSTQSSNYEVIKTENSKMINGYQCYQWRVRNRLKNSEISYWVTRDGFYFFDDMLKLLNNIGNLSEFFLQIPDSQGYLPILTVERTLVRYEKLSLAVTGIEYTKLNRTLFEIPKDYKVIDY